MLEKHVGLTKTLKKPAPPPSEPGFKWPGRNEVTAALRKNFGAAIRELCSERSIDYRELGRQLYGTATDAKGYLIVANGGGVRLWARGEKVPLAATAAYIAHYFQVPLERLLRPNGNAPPFELRRPHKNGKGAREDQVARMKATYNGNGAAHPEHEHKRPGPRPHAGFRAVRAPIERLALPADAPPVGMRLETFKADPRFVVIHIEGTVQVEIGLSLMALLHPEPEPPASG